MKLQERIKADFVSAMKNQNKELKLLLSVVIGEMDRVNKVLTDDQVIAIVKKMIEGAKSTNKLDEVALLEKYLPSQLSEAQLSGLIGALIYTNSYTPKDMGKIMSALKQAHSGQYDGKLASSIAKELLTNTVA